MATPMNSVSFRSAVTPVMNKIFDGVYNLRKDEWKPIFKVEAGIPRAYHEEPVFYGLGSAPTIAEGASVTFGSGGELFKAIYTYNVYGLGFALTKILVEDGDHIRLGKIFAEHLAQAMVETKETLTANVLNRAFNASYIGGDGVSLSSAAHPIAMGNTFSNILSTAAALSQTSLEQMIINVRQAVNNEGKKVRLSPKHLVIPPALMLQAEVLLKSVLRTGSSVNDINPIASGGLVDKAVVISRLTSATAWWIQTDAQQGLKLLTRRPLEKSMEGDFESDSMKYKATERYGLGWTDPRTVFGTPGQ
jgi:hypothetical protein